MNKRAQSSFEFILVLGLMLLIILGSFAVIQGRLTSITNEHKAEIMSQLGNVIRTELISADVFNGEYYRVFVLPEAVQGYKYNVSITAISEVTLRIDQQEYVLFLNSNLSGNISAGRNTIRKYSNGTITINL